MSPSDLRRPGRYRLLAAVLALPLAIGLATSASAAAPAAPVAPADSLLLGAPMTSEGVSITIDGKTYTTGPLEGRIDIQVTGDAVSGIVWKADFELSSPVDPNKVGDFGQVRVRTVAASSGQTPSLPNLTEGDLAVYLSIEFEKNPAGGEPRTLLTDSAKPAVLRAVESFPPVNQTYTLQDPVPLYSEDQSEPVGTLEGFPVVVNQSVALQATER